MAIHTRETVNGSTGDEHTRALVVPHRSEIEWTGCSWNPVTGCCTLSPGCDNCYARRFAERFRGVRGHPYENGFDLQLRPERLLLPLRWKEDRIFVCSMSDLFQKNVPKQFISEVFNSMERASWHNFQLLTKRSSLMRNFMNHRYGDGKAPENIWCGVSVEGSRYTSRIRHLQQTCAAVRFVSFEPLLGPVGKLDLSGVHWVIVGGESGPGFRKMKAEWAREIRDQCQERGIPLFFKQWGGFRRTSGGHLLDGKEWRQFPEVTEPVQPSREERR